MRSRSYVQLTLALLAFGGRAEAAAPAPTTPERRIHIEPAVQLSYDSNIYLTSDSAAAAGQKRDDFRITPALNLDLLIPVGRQSFFLTGSLGYDFYTKNSILNRERLNLDGGANLRILNACSSTVSGAYSRQRSQYGSIFSLLLEPNTEERKSAGVQARCLGTVGFGPSGGYRHEDVSNSSPFFRLRDFVTDTYNFGLDYTRPSLGTISLYGTYSNGTYPNRLFLVPPGVVKADGIQSYSAGVSFERRIGSRLTGNASIGYTWVNPKLAGSKFRGASYSAALTFVPTERTQLNVSISRSTELSNVLDVGFSVTDAYQISGVYHVSRTIALTYGASRVNHNYKNSPLLNTPLTVNNDQITTENLGLSYQIGRRIGLSSFFKHEVRGSDNETFRYHDVQAGVGANLTF